MMVGVVGEDGVRGMEGLLIDPIGKLVGATGLPVLLKVPGEGLSQAQLDVSGNGLSLVQTVESGNVGSYAAGQGVEKAAQRYSQLIEKRQTELVPHVRVLLRQRCYSGFSKNIYNRRSLVTGLMMNILTALIKRLAMNYLKKSLLALT
ncbi:MAG: hypothetical protein R3A13_02120 [Bdellovibrionota bacterium]